MSITNITSEDIFLGRKQEDFDLAEKLLVKYGELSDKCVCEMTDTLFGRMGIVECYEILQRVWNNMHVKKIEDVLAEFALEIDPSADIAVTGAETIKKFAAKLQLRDDTE